jgi:hypothetical protein
VRRPAARPKPGEAAAGRHLAGREQLGQQVRGRVEAQQDQRVTVFVEQDVPRPVAQSVTNHLGLFAALSPSAARQASTRGGPLPALLAGLRTADGVRKAIIFGEVFQPPLSLRKGNRGPRTL